MTIFGSSWRSLGTILAPFCNQVGHGCTQMDSGRSQDGFLMIFETFWVPLWTPFWVIFWYVLSFEAPKDMFGLQTWFSTIFEWKICWFVMSQPIKSIVNNSVFIRFRFFDFFMNLMISGPCLDLILDTFEGLGRPFKWFFGVLDMHWNFVDFQDHPELRQWTWWRVNCVSRASSNKSYITSLLTSRLSNTSLLTCWPSNSNCWWNVGRILEILHQWMIK